MLAAASRGASLLLLTAAASTTSSSSSVLGSQQQQLRLVVAARPSQRRRALTTKTASAGAGASSPSTMEFAKVEFGTSGAYGYEAGPKDAPAVIVLQEWWGVNDIIKQLALKVAECGPFRVVVPDLYRGKVGVDAEEASHLMGALDFKAAVGELSDAARYLRASGSAKIGITGFCMGGALALAAAQHCGVDCAAPFYGIPEPAICDPALIRVPVALSFGRLDAMRGFSDPDAAVALLQRMERSGAPASLHLYDGCGHAFMNALTPEGRAKIKEIGQPDPPEEEVRAAFGRLATFLKAHLLGA